MKRSVNFRGHGPADGGLLGKVGLALRELDAARAALERVTRGQTELTEYLARHPDTVAGEWIMVAALRLLQQTERERDDALRLALEVSDKLEETRAQVDQWQETSECWRRAHSAWQSWARELLDSLGRQPLHGEHGDGPAREVIAQLAVMAPGVPRCSNCGCFSTSHEVDDEERRECTECECKQYELPPFGHLSRANPDDAGTMMSAPPETPETAECKLCRAVAYHVSPQCPIHGTTRERRQPRVIAP